MCVRFVNVNRYTDGVPKHWKRNGCVHATYNRFFIPRIFCNYEKVLWLDTDIIICRDVAALYQTQLTDSDWVGAVLDTYVRLKKRNDIGFEDDFFRRLENPMNYFQAGVLLFNITAWWENRLLEECFRQSEVMGETRWKDQDILNVFCQNHVLFLDPKWNVEWGGCEALFSGLADKGIDIREEKEAYLKCLEDPFILHFTGAAGKPWKAPYHNNIRSQIWWKYARMLPDYEAIIYTNICSQIREEQIKISLEHTEKYFKQKLEYPGKECLGVIRQVRTEALESVLHLQVVVRETVLLPLTWINLQCCRLASHLLFGKVGQHYAEKKRMLRKRIEKALSFLQR